MINITRIGL